MTRISDHVQVLARPFAHESARAVQRSLDALAHELGAAEGDDGLVDIGEHSQIWLKLKTARKAAAQYQSSLGALGQRGVLDRQALTEQTQALERALRFLQQLGLAQDGAVSQGRLTGYRLALRGTEPVVTPDARRTAFVTNLGGGGYTTYVPRHLFEGHLGRDYRVDTTPRERQVSGTEFVDSGVTYLDTRTGREAPFAEVYNQVKRSQFAAARLQTGSLSQPGPQRQLSVLALAAGRGELRAESFRGVELPAMLGGGRRDVQGVRLVWVLAASLRDSQARGFEASRVRDWMSRNDVQAASAAVLEAIDGIEVSAYDGYLGLFLAAGPRPELLRQMVETGVLALSHDEAGQQVIPDYQLRQAGGTLVRSPSGPLVLLYDPPLAAETLPGEATPYRFGVDGVRFKPKAGLARVSADESLSHAGKDLRTGAGLDAVSATIEQIVEATLLRGDLDGALGVYGPELDLLANKLENLLAQKRQELGARRAELTRIESGKSFLASLWFDSADENRLEDEVGALQTLIDRADALRGGTQLLLAALGPAGGANGPGYWRARLAEAFARVRAHEGPAATAAWEAELARLVREQNDAKQASAAVSRSADAFAAAVESYASTEVAWHQAWGWLDRLIGGESAEGRLYRTGKGQRDVQLGASAELAQLAAGAGDDVILSIHKYLMQVPVEEKYRADFAELGRVQPAYLALVATMKAADEARTALARADQAILYRNLLAASEPYPEYESVPVYDSEGKVSHHEERETYAHRSWESQYDAAKMQALYWSSQAESAMRDLAAELPRLKQALQSAGFQSFVETNIATDLDPLLHYFFDLSFMWFSFDASKVNQMQSDVAEVVGQLTVLRAQVEPRYVHFRSAVDERRQREYTRLLGL